jgi:hypothetical protein
MDLSSLASLGKLAGMGGIAIGAVVLLVRPLIDKAGKAKPEQLALFRLIAIGAFAIGVLGIVAWAMGTGRLRTGRLFPARAGRAVRGRRRV